MYYDDNEQGNESTREKRRQLKQKKTANSDVIDTTPEVENINSKVPFEEHGIPSYRKKQNRKRRSRNVESGDDLDTTERRSSRKPKSPTTRLPRSVSEEVLALEGRFHPDGNSNKQRRTRRYRDKTDTDPDISVEKPPTGHRGNQSASKRRRKPRSALVDNSGDSENYQGDIDGEISEFQVDDEDIVDGSYQNTNKTHTPAITQPTLPSQPVDFMFIEKKDGNGFLREHRSSMPKANQDKADYAIQLLDAAKNVTTADFMLKVHLSFRQIAIIIHGLLAGMALTQCVFVYILASINDRNLLQNYYKLAQPFQSIFYILLAICCVSVFDRYINISASWGQLFMRLFSKPSRFLAVSLYILSLLLSVSIAAMDDRISLQEDLPNLWASTSRLRTWKIVNLLRVTGSVIGWIMVAIAPNDDYTEKMIREVIQIDDDSKVQYEMKHLPSSPRGNGYWNGNHQ